MRKYVSIIIGLILIGISVSLVVIFIKNSNKEKPKMAQGTKSITVNIVKNKTIPVHINSTGSLIAKNKIEIYSEVQGVLNISEKEFKAGTFYAKGEIMLSINKDEQLANFKSLKSNLLNSLLLIMPDMKLDFPREYEKWQAYLSSFDLDNRLLELPIATSDRERFFLAGKNIYTQYHNIESLYVRLIKYTIRAPYDGVLTEALVTQGTLIRQGQKLGEFINANTYEIELAIKSSFIEFIKTGNPVKLNNIENTKSWQGTVIRINGKIDQTSLTFRVFVEVNANDLLEGMYLEAELLAKSETNAFEIDRNLLIGNDKIFAVSDASLYLVQINPVFFNDNSVIVKGLKDGTKIISKPLPGAFEGMKVKINNGNKAK